MAKTIEERAEEHTKVLRYTMPNSDVGNVLSNLTCKAYSRKDCAKNWRKNNETED